jgi:hypothetical protein
MPSNIRWGRIILAAILLEVAIIAVALPAGLFFGNPLAAEPGGPPVDPTGYNIVVAFACFLLGAVFGAWAVVRATSGFAFQGLMVGLVAMAIYLGLCSLAPGGIAAVIAGYGLTLFVIFNALRTLGCVAGAMYKGARQAR